MKFRKKPVVIEAKMFDGSINSGIEITRWINDNGGDATAGSKFGVKIKTLEGDHTASPGDWIIQGVKGEFYPCKPDIFEMTYEKVSD